MSESPEFKAGTAARPPAGQAMEPGTDTKSAGPSPLGGASPATPGSSGFALPFDPWRIVDAMARKWWLILLVGVIGTAAGGYLGKRKFKESCVVTAQLIRQDLPATFRSSEVGEAFKPRQINAQTLISLMRAPALLERVGNQASNRYSARALLGALTITPERNTDLIRVTFATSRSPAEAISLINLYGKEVVRLTQELTAGEAGEINRLLKRELARVDEDINRIKQEMLAYARQVQLLDADKELDASLRKLSEFDIRYEGVRIEFETSDIRIQALEKELANHNESASRLQEGRDQLAQLRQKYTDANPLVQEQAERVKTLEKELEESLGKPIEPPRGTGQGVATSLYIDLFQQRSQKAVLGEQLIKMKAVRETLTEKLKGIPEQGMELATMRGRLGTLNGTRALLASRQREAQQFEDNNFGYYRFFDAQREDVEVQGPGNKVVLLGIALGLVLAGFVAAVCGLRESLDDRIRTGADLKRATALPVLGALPVLPGIPPQVPPAWALRLWTQLQPQLLPEPGPARWLALGSHSRGEGVSTFIGGFAVAAARRDARVLALVDTAPPGTTPVPLADALTQPSQLHPGPGEITWIQIPADWVWDGPRRGQWVAALNLWRAAGLSGFLEAPPITQPETLLLLDTVPHFLWVCSAGGSRAGEVGEQFLLLRHTSSRLVGALLNREPKLILGLGRLAPLTLAAFALLASPAFSPLQAQSPNPAPAAPQAPAESSSPTPSVIPVAPKPEAPLVFAGTNAKLRGAWQKRLTLGPNDVVNFAVYGRSDLIRTDVAIEPDGRISYLEAQDLPANGLTIEELRDLTERELTKYHRNFRVIVTPAAWRSKKIYILGKVVNKGAFPLSRPMTVIEAVAQAAGLETGLFQLNTVELADLPRSFLIREGRRVPVDFDKLFLHGDLTQNILLEPNDYLYFPSSIANEIYILGAVGSPGAQGLTEKASVLSVVTLAGGFSPRAFRQRILVVRGSIHEPKTFIVNAADILAGRGKDFILEPRDIVYVADKPWARAEELLDMAASSFIQSMVTVWTGANIGPFITKPILPSIK